MQFTHEGATFTFGAVEQFIVLHCYKCRCPFAVPEALQRKWREKCETFYCPCGHDQHYTVSENEKLRKQLASATAALDQARAAGADELRRRLTAERGRAIVKGKLKHVKARIKNGVCPHCNRYFENLHRHMTNQHGGKEVEPREDATS